MRSNFLLVIMHEIAPVFSKLRATNKAVFLVVFQVKIAVQQLGPQKVTENGPLAFYDCLSV